MDAALHRVLYVEDDPDIRTLAGIALSEIGGFDVTSCESGNEAVAKIGAVNPQIAILDVMMPDMDGPLTFKTIRTMPEFARLPVIFMTAKATATEVESYMALGALGVIVKPFDPMTLADQVRELWRKAS